MKTIACLFFISTYIMCFSQDAVFYKLPTGLAPVIDGKVDEIWNGTKKYKIDNNFINEEPSLNDATWQAVWNDTAIFIIVEIDDDDFYPSWKSGLESWQSDNIELYLDVDSIESHNFPLPRTGLYMFNPDYSEFEKGKLLKDSLISYSNTYDEKNANMVFEYLVPFTTLVNYNNDILNPYLNNTIKFGVVVSDLDKNNITRQRTAWPDFYEDEWVNPDKLGEVIFSTQKVVKPKAIIYKLPAGCEIIVDGEIDEN
ncbi:MAG: hypothetical protein JXB17_08595 [Bacteroidales bacterium]|nr:hypothetical protein [Bacteroidales bacterium]